jgi:serine/threonine protein kinase
MFHPADLTPPRALVAKTPADPLQTMRPYQLLDPTLQGLEGEIFVSNVIGIGDVAIKVLKTPRHSLEGSPDDIVELEYSLKLSGAPVAELLSYHEWNDQGLIRNAAVYRYYPGGDLFGHLTRLHRSKAISPQHSEKIAYSVVKMLCTCLVQIHASGWVHADIKPENILLSHDAESSDCQAYLADFGQARRIGSTICSKGAGSKGYFPVRDFPYVYGPAQPSLDLFSVGIVLKAFGFIHPLPLHAQSVCNMLCARNADERPTAAQMLQTHLPAWLSAMDHLTE